MDHNSYSLCDSGYGRKLERFGPYLLSRPCAIACWKKKLQATAWDEADATFSRDEDNRWRAKNELPASWTTQFGNLILKIQPTDFGHLGVFPEQAPFWAWMENGIRTATRSCSPIRVLNLFAYSGGASLACARGGAEVVHLDASKGMISWARENAALNNLSGAPIRWICDDVTKFLNREKKRGKTYDAIILDPPSFGRGPQGEIFKIENEIVPLLEKVRSLLSEQPLFVLLSCHTPGFTPLALQNLMKELFSNGSLVVGEMVIEGATPLPSGVFARWSHAP
jgi:23S rRNA (cytosine1962-C5)-methyltransferase